MINIDFRQKNGRDLSNMVPRTFMYDDIKCHSMEGLLNAVKEENEDKARYLCSLHGWTAQRAGKDINWWDTQTLWWKGIPIDRHSDEYQSFLDIAYANMFAMDKGAKEALIKTYPYKLGHNVGGNDPNHTILTVKEFISRLEDIRLSIVQMNLMTF